MYNLLSEIHRKSGMCSPFDSEEEQNVEKKKMMQLKKKKHLSKVLIPCGFDTFFHSGTCWDTPG